LQVDAHRAQRLVGALQAGRFGVRGHAGLVARRAEAVHADVGVRAQLAGEVLDVDPGATVDVRRVLAGQEIDPGQSWFGHMPNISPASARWAGDRRTNGLASAVWLPRSSRSSWPVERASGSCR